MKRIDFPLGGNLRPGDVLRTTYLDKDECIIRDMKSAEGQSLFELALDDYEPGCRQEVWSTSGSGAFVHRDWKDGIPLPNLLIYVDKETGQRIFYLSSQDGSNIEEIDNGRQDTLFDKILKSSQYIPMSWEDFQEWGEDYRVWNRQK